MKFVALKKHIAEEKPFPCYVISGDDGYIVKKAASMLRELAGDMPQFNLHFFEDNAKPADIVACCQSYPLLFGRVVVEVRNYTADAAPILDYLSNPSVDTVLVFVSASPSKSLATIAKTQAAVECDRLDEVSLARWAKKRCSDYGCTISGDAASRLIDYCERYMSRIEMEVEKLTAYRINGNIDVRDVESLVTPSADYRIYQLGDAIAQGRCEAAVSVLSSILTSNPAAYVISGLYTHFRRLLYASISKDAGTAEYLGVKEFAVTAARRTASKIPPKKLKEICDRLQQADNDFKSGQITDTVAAQVFVSRCVLELSAR